MTEEEKKAIEQLEGLKILFEIDDNSDFEATPKMQKQLAYHFKIILNLIQKQQEEIEKLRNEREYIKNNLAIDLNRKGIYSEAKGQISQILEYYKNNDKYFGRKAEV